MLLLVTFIAAASSPDGNWTKFLLTDAAAKTGAVCLDGSPGGGYIRRGSGSGAKKWIVFHQGEACAHLCFGPARFSARYL